MRIMKIFFVPLAAKFLFFSTATLALLSPQMVFASPSPGITAQPQSQNVQTGSNVVFTVTASGNSPLIYQWSFNGTRLTNSAHISGATNYNVTTATLTVSNVTATDAGN